MLNRLLLLVVLLGVVLLAGCNVYHPLKDGVGYTEVPVGQDNFQVTYVGDSSMSVAEARQMCLTRAAELAALKGNPYFQIIDERIYLSYGTQYWPGDNAGFVETYPDRRGRTRAVIHHVYDPGYTELYMIPEVIIQIRTTTAPEARTIPAGYILRQAQQNGTKLSPGVADRIATFPDSTTSVDIPPPPAATTKPVR